MKTFNILDRDLDLLGYHFLEASAGTGKTFAIEHIYVRLVLEGLMPESILVMTFTKAATRELIERIHAALRKAFEELEKESQAVDYLAAYQDRDPSILSTAKRRLQAALAVFDEARIETIHGFCHSMLAKYAFEGGIHLGGAEERGGIYQKMKEVVIDLFRSKLQPEVITPVQLAFAIPPGRGLKGLIEEVIKRIHPHVHSALPDFAQVCQLIETKLQEIGSRCMGEDFAQYLRFYNKMGSLEWQGEMMDRWLKTGRVRAAEVEQILTSKVYFWENICEENLSKKQIKKFQEAHFQDPALPGLLKEKLGPILTLASKKKPLLDKLAFLSCLEWEKHRGDLMTPDELLATMQEVLQKPQFVELARGEFSAVIVDEFQDTDQMQWDIFERLFLEGRPLKAFYLVGDPKQSIYAFRRADLYAYLKAKESFAPEEIAHLSINYRSEHHLIHALNGLFLRKIDAHWMRLPALDRSLEIHPIVHPLEGVEDSLGVVDGRRGSLHILLTEVEGKEEEWENQFLFPFLVQELLRLRSLRFFPLSSVAILVKDRYQAARLLRFLRRFTIEGVYARAESIGDSPLVSAFIDLLSVLDSPPDLAAIKTVLAGHFVAWSHHQLKGGWENRELYRAFCDLEELKNIFQESGIAALLESFLQLSFGDSHTILAKMLGRSSLEYYHDFCQLQELLLEEAIKGKKHLRQLILFLESLKTGDMQEDKRLKRTQIIDEHAVTLMTVYSSKGLEFDVVFAIALGFPTRADQEEEAESLYERDAEKMRLLYVGLTRGKRRTYLPLVLWKNKGESKLGTASPAELLACRFGQERVQEKDLYVLLNQLTRAQIEQHLESLKDCYITWSSLSVEHSCEVEEVADVSPQIVPPKKWDLSWQPIFIESFSSLARQQEEVFEYAQNLTVRKDDELPLGAETGELVHAILEKIFRAGWHHPLDREKIRAWIDHITKKEEWIKWRDTLYTMIEDTLSIPLLSPHGKFCLQELDPNSVRTEVEFLYWKEGQYLKGFIDLVFEKEGIYYLIDWKTNWLFDYSSVALSEAMDQHHYNLQAAIYTEALRRYVKLFDNRPFEECFGGAHYLFLRGMSWISVYKS